MPDRKDGREAWAKLRAKQKLEGGPILREVKITSVDAAQRQRWYLAAELDCRPFSGWARHRLDAAAGEELRDSRQHEEAGL
jgi:hypothetical protein